MPLKMELEDLFGSLYSEEAIKTRFSLFPKTGNYRVFIKISKDYIMGKSEKEKCTVSGGNPCFPMSTATAIDTLNGFRTFYYRGYFQMDTVIVVRWNTYAC
jgi:hypothetical protein